MLSTLSKTEIIILATFNLSSANAFDLDQSRNLLFGKELTQYHTMLRFDVLQIYSCGKHCETTAANCRNICPSYTKLQPQNSSIKTNKGQ